MGAQDERTEDEPGSEPEEADVLETVVLPLEDTLDLHSFPPRQIADLVRAWLDEVHEHGFSEVRIIHGKGVGVQREIVRTLLERDPRVASFGDASDAGGWGATRVIFRAHRPA